MAPRFYKPHPALAGFVLNIMVAEVHGGYGGRTTPYPPMPLNCLNFYPGDPIRMQKQGDAAFVALPESVFVGPQVTRVNIGFGVQHRFVSVVFQPGAVFRLWGIPLSEVFDQPFDARLLFGPELREVNERLREAVGFEEMKTVVDGFLLRRWAGASVLLPVDRAIQALVGSGGLLSIDQAAADSCLSIRQFERKCRDMVGVSPKLFARVIRFSNAFRLKERSPLMRWTEVAHACGYFDQMHFIKDFKVFAGVTPSFFSGELDKAGFRLQANLPW